MSNSTKTSPTAWVIATWICVLLTCLPFPLVLNVICSFGIVGCAIGSISTGSKGGLVSGVLALVLWIVSFIMGFVLGMLGMI